MVAPENSRCRARRTKVWSISCSWFPGTRLGLIGCIAARRHLPGPGFFNIPVRRWTHNLTPGLDNGRTNRPQVPAFDFQVGFALSRCPGSGWGRNHLACRPLLARWFSISPCHPRGPHTQAVAGSISPTECTLSAIRSGPCALTDHFLRTTFACPDSAIGTQNSTRLVRAQGIAEKSL